MFFFCFFSGEIKIRLTGHHTSPHVLLVFRFSLFVPPPLFLHARLFFGRASFCFWRFFGVPFWAPGVFGILLGLSDPCFRTRGGTGVRVVSCLCRFWFPLFVVFAASHARKPMPFWEVRLRLLPAPRESDPQGSPCGLWFGDHILGLVFAVSLLLLVGSQGPIWALFWEGCVRCPLRPSRARFAPRPLFPPRPPPLAHARRMALLSC